MRLKMQRLARFPRLLRFLKWLGFIILDVNSCSNLAFTGQEQCQGWPRKSRWQQIAPTKKKLQGKKAGLSYIHTTFVYSFVFSFLCSDLGLCYFKMSHLKVISSDRHPLTVFIFSLSLSLLKASESLSPSGETEYE